MLDLSRPQIMGVINITPDSFSDGGHFFDQQNALEHARRLIDEGADILDIGGESTRPGSAVVSVDEELRRTVPIIESIRGFSSVPISIDTSKARVMTAAAAAGADLINDVWALRQPGALEAAANSGLIVCLMHMQGNPQTMQESPEYENVLMEVAEFLKQRARQVCEAGIDAKKIIIDPGFGFGKTLQQNLQLLNSIDKLVELGFPVLAGISRKSMIGTILDKPVDQRLYGSIAAAVIAVLKGAKIIRVHDVAETRDAIRVADAVMDIQKPGQQL